MTGLILTDKVSVTGQPSKLWSSASKFYQSRAPNTTMNISLDDVQQSVRTFLKESSGGTSHNSQHDSSKFNLSHSLTGMLPKTPPRHLLRSPLPQTSFIALPKPSNGWANRALGTIIAIETSARKIGATLSFEDDTPPEDAILQTLLKNAVYGVESAGKSLEEVKHHAKDILDHKEKVITMLRMIDAHITWLGATLPPPTPEQTPIFFDACK